MYHIVSNDKRKMISYLFTCSYFTAYFNVTMLRLQSDGSSKLPQSCNLPSSQVTA